MIEQGKCPKCGKTIEDYDDFVPEDESTYYPFECKSKNGGCGFEGKEYRDEDEEFICFCDNDGNEI